MSALPRRALFLAPALLAVALLGPGQGALGRLAADPAAERLIDVLRVLAMLAPLVAAALALRFHQLRLALGGLALAGMGLALLVRPLSLEGPGLPALALSLALALGLGSRLPERSPSSVHGLRALALASLLGALPALLCLSHAEPLARALLALGPAVQPSPGLGLPWTGLVGIGVALVACWNAPGRDADVIGPSLACMLLACVVASWMWPGLPPAIALLGGTGMLLGSVLVTAWRRGYIDDLTQLPGRRALDIELDSLSGTYALAVIDVDHFKRFNDEHGHDAGDDALRIVANVLRSLGCGVAYRQGGEEFVAVLPGLSADEAADALDDLREAIESTPLLVRGRQGRRRGALRVTASFGVAARTEANPSARDTLRAADLALLRAKKLGRNRVEVERRRLPRVRIKEPARASRIVPGRRSADVRPAPRRGAARGR